MSLLQEALITIATLIFGFYIFLIFIKKLREKMAAKTRSKQEQMEEL